jgi:hypothetical protein
MFSECSSHLQPPQAVQVVIVEKLQIRIWLVLSLVSHYMAVFGVMWARASTVDSMAVLLNSCQPFQYHACRHGCRAIVLAARMHNLITP